MWTYISLIIIAVLLLQVILKNISIKILDIYLKRIGRIPTDEELESCREEFVQRTLRGLGL